MIVYKLNKKFTENDLKNFIAQSLNEKNISVNFDDIKITHRNIILVSENKREEGVDCEIELDIPEENENGEIIYQKELCDLETLSRKDFIEVPTICFRNKTTATPLNEVIDSAMQMILGKYYEKKEISTDIFSKLSDDDIELIREKCPNILKVVDNIIKDYKESKEKRENSIIVRYVYL